MLIVGGILVPLWSWRSVFWFLTALALLLVLATLLVVRETLPAQERRAGGIRSALVDMVELLRTPGVPHSHAAVLGQLRDHVRVHLPTPMRSGPWKLAAFAWSPRAPARGPTAP